MEPIEWKAPAFKYREKGPGWYSMTVIITVILMALAVSQKNFFLVIFLIVSEAMIILWAKKEPPILNFRIDEKGVAIGADSRYNYADLAGFRIRESEEMDEGGFDDLILKRKNALTPYVKIALQKNHSEKARTALSQKLNEEEYEESLLDLLADWIGF